MNLSINDNKSSCVIKINAKGMFAGEIKVYDEVAKYSWVEAKSLSEMLEKLIKEKNQLVNNDDTGPSDN